RSGLTAGRSRGAGDGRSAGADALTGGILSVQILQCALKQFGSELRRNAAEFAGGPQLINQEFRLIAGERKIVFLAELCDDKVGHLVAAVEPARLRDCIKDASVIFLRWCS